MPTQGGTDALRSRMQVPTRCSTRLVAYQVPLLTLSLFLGPAAVAAQAGTGMVVVRVLADSAPLAGAAVRSGRIGAYTDVRGEARLTLGAGTVSIRVSRVGYGPDSLVVELAAGATETRTVTLHEETTELEEITVTTTRGERRLDDEPIRVEVLEGGDVAEKTQMRPSDLTRLLTEMVGVRIQPSAGALGPTRFRIQGLRGQYTGLLSDGLPLLGGQPSGFSILEIAPVDLQQAEVIKGAATSLYGPSAIGGLINLVSKRPDHNTGILELNQTERGGSDIIYWGARRVSPTFGYTVTAEGHHQSRKDLDRDGWADFASQNRVGVRPRLYWDKPNGDQLFGTLGVFGVNREGGFADPTRYRERLETRRVDLGLRGRRVLSGASNLSFRLAATTQRDDHTFGAVNERDRKNSVLGELTASGLKGSTAWVVGAAWQGDWLTARETPGFDFAHRSPALFGQVTANPGDGPVSFAISGRCDWHNVYGTRCSPRAALVARPTEQLTARVSGATGFFAPTPFTEETEAIGLTPLVSSRLVAERARTASLDLSWKKGIVQISGTVARSRIANPTALVPAATPGRVELVNVPGPTTITSGELFLVVEAAPVVITAFYGYLDGTELDPETNLRRVAGYTPKHSVGMDLAWEGESTWIALEAFYTGTQAVYDNPFRTRSKPYLNPELLISQRIGKVRFYFNGENLFDLRQTNYERLVLPTPGLGGVRTTTPWAPTDGRILSIGALIDF